ncbi:MAG TPA: hypothetical protein VFD30_03430 [Terriglobia bacterium]|nr:hypothetical protein [Terriglobia bacterium]
MNLDLDSVPMKWPCGPLEIHLQSKAQPLKPQTKETLETWAKPQALEILKESPVKCLIVPWAAGETQDLEHQQVLRSLVDAGRKLGIEFVGSITGKADRARAVAAARQAGLAAVLSDEPSSPPAELPVLVMMPRSKVDWSFPGPGLDCTENTWPGVALETTKEGEQVIAGPTGVPWVNSNGWFALLGRALTQGKILWLDYDPPVSSDLAHPANYILAVADARAYGAQWVISLDAKIRAALLKRNPETMCRWEDIAAAEAFFQAHKAWSLFAPHGVLAVVSDFRGDHAFLSGEVLNLLSRRYVQFRIFDKARAGSIPFEGLKAILWLDPDAPGAALQSKLLAFVRQGGILITSGFGAISEGQLVQDEFSDRYEMRRLGKGRLAKAKKAFDDPYQMAVDTHLILSRRNDLVRVFNTGMTNCYCSSDPKRGTGLVQVLNYSSNPAEFVSVWVRTHCASARLWTLETKTPAVAKGTPAAGGMEFHLPRLSTYAAIEFDRWSS